MSLPPSLYRTNFGAAYVGDSHDLLKSLEDESISLVITSPPFALQRQKDYPSPGQDEYVDWLMEFTSEIWRILDNSGSFVLDLGGSYKKGRPVRSLYNYKVLIHLCEDQGWNLAEEFFWHNPSKLPSPIEWVNKKKIRVKDSVNTIWWLSKTDFPKADVVKVLKPYSDRMKKLLKDQERYYEPKKRPSGHDISERFRENKGGSIPSNLFDIPNTVSNSKYMRACRMLNLKIEPARFPIKLPQFFIKFLTNKNDTVLDIFAGSNATGAAAELLGRKWLAFELSQSYLASSSFRFLKLEEKEKLKEIYTKLSRNPPEDFKFPCDVQLQLGENKDDLL